MTDKEFVQLLEIGHEKQGIEFKAPGPLTDKHLAARVAKAMLGMANRRDGGHVIIGMNDSGGQLSPVGLVPADLATWNNDRLSDIVSVYADPNVSFEFEVRTVGEDKFILIQVHEFQDIPILCKKNHDDPDARQVLRQGACYVRSRHKPETSEIPTQADMRDLLDLAVDKEIRRFLARAQKTGIALNGGQQINDKNKFDSQLGAGL